jgi:hypothetical protein
MKITGYGIFEQKIWRKKDSLWVLCKKFDENALFWSFD